MESKPEENTIFSLIIEIKKHAQQKEIMQILFQILYFCQLTAIFIMIVNQHLPIVNTIFQSLPLLFLIGVATGMVIIQISMAFVWNVHLQLYNQLVFYRYSIFPLAMIFFASQINNPYYFASTRWVPLFFMTIQVVSMYMLCNLVFHRQSSKQIVYSSSEYSKYLVLSDFLMVMILPSASTIWMPVILMSWTVLTIVISYQMYIQVRKTISNKFTCFIAYFKMYLLLMWITNKLVYSDGMQNKVLLVSSPIIIIMFLFSFMYIGKQTLEANIFNGQANIEEFIRFIYIISSEINAIKTTSCYSSPFIVESAPKVVVSYINRAYVFLTQTYQQIQNSGENSYRKMVIHKIVKKIESLLDIYEENNVDLKIKIIKMQFYSVHLANKLKIKNILSTIQYQKLSLKDKLVVYQINEKTNEMSSNDFIDSSKAEDQYQHFKKKIMQMLVLLRQFWSALTEEKVDMNSLIMKSSKVFPIKRQIQFAWKKSLTEEKFSSWNIIKTYTIYCKNILHDFTRSCILDDYSKILETRLKSKQELGYMKFDTQAGVVTISLSEASLGNLHSANSLAARLFNYYNIKQMLSLRVNDIMPGVYSIVHDDILNSFLKNRFKSINQDERLLFGRNKNGFIFPLQLQLRKLSWNTNDELIFLANVNSIKTKSAPILCIVDLEGDVKDISSTFSWLFMSNQKKIENIQVIIPSFFKIIQEQQEDHQSKYVFSQKCSVNKSSCSFDVQFTGYPLYIKGNRVGYMIEGRTVDQINTINHKRKILEQLLKNNLGKIYFNQAYFRYEIEQDDIKVFRQPIQDLNIPFLRTNDIQIMFGGHTNSKIVKSKVYGESIRTFRLVNNRIELAVDQSSFASEISEQNWRQSSVLKRIQRMHQQISIQNKKNVVSFYKIVVEFFGIVCIITGAVLLFETIIMNNKLIQINSSLLEMWKIRTLFPELLVYSYFPISLGNNTQKIAIIRSEFMKSLSLSSIAEWQKESLLKHINSAYSQEKITFESNLLTFIAQNPSQQNTIIILLFFLVTLLFVQLIAVMCLFNNYETTIQKMYSIFLSVTEKKLTGIMKESQNLYQYLLNSSNCLLDEEGGQHIIDEQSDQEESPMMKKIKKSTESWDKNIAYRLTIPILFLFLIILAGGVFLTLLIGQNKIKTNIWMTGSEMLPSSSLATMQKLFKFLNMTGNFSLSNRFSQLQQEFERQIFISNFNSLQIDIWLKGNLCIEPAYYQLFSAQLQGYCLQNMQGDNSLANNLNILDSFLVSSLNQTSAKWVQIVQIQFELIKPLLTYTMNEIQSLVQKQAIQIQSYLIIISIGTISLVCILTIYFIRFPMKQMDEKIIFTKDLISIIPSEKDQEPNITLATLTTEALDFREYYE